MFACIRLFLIKDFDLKSGPKYFPIKKPKFEEFLYPIILNRKKRIFTTIYSIKYIIIFIIF